MMQPAMVLALSGILAHIAIMAVKGSQGTLVPKIEKLITEARTYLRGYGISTEGKRGHEIIAMAREHRNRPQAPKQR